MSIARRLSAAALAALMTLGLTACSGGEESSTAAKSGLEDGVLTVAMECAYAPYNWTQADDSNGAVPIKDSNNYANGYDVIIAKKLAEELGVELEIVKSDWDSLIPAVQSGTVDCVIAGQSITADRMQQVDFTEPYFYATIVTLTKSDSQYASAASVADLSGATATSQMNTIWYNNCLPQIPDANILPAQADAPAMLVALNSGTCDIVVTDKPTGLAACVAYPDFTMLDFTGTEGEFEVSDEDINIGISLKKGNTELKEKLDSVLSTMTSSMLLNFSMMNEDITAAAASIIKTLPRDEVRKISYSTFCLCDIDCFGNTRIAEYENPAYYLFRGGQFVDVEKKRIPVERDDMGQTAMWLSEFAMEKEDRIIFFSDGVSQSGMGNRNMPFGWEEGAKAFIRECVARNPSISAKELARKVVIESEKNDGYTLKDDTSCCVIYMRKPRNLLICTGPPFDEKNDAYLSKLVTEFPGRKIICGGTTANILSRETGREITLDMEMMEPDLPPASRMEGIDLITEGILTLSRVESLLSGDGGEGQRRGGPADQILQMLADSDKITFLVGTRINIAHQDPTLPVELEIRRNVVKKIKYLLETKWLKDVDITYL